MEPQPKADPQQGLRVTGRVASVCVCPHINEICTVRIQPIIVWACVCVCVNLSIHAADSSSPDSISILTLLTSARSPFLCALFKQCSLTHLLPLEGEAQNNSTNRWGCSEWEVLQYGDFFLRTFIKKTVVRLCCFNNLLRDDFSNCLVAAWDCKCSLKYCSSLYNISLLMPRQKLGHIDRLHVWLNVWSAHTAENSAVHREVVLCGWYFSCSSCQDKPGFV